MTHYNPELHHDTLVEYIASAMMANLELDQPLMPCQNDGNPTYALYTGEETYLFTSFESWKELYLDAYTTSINRMVSSDMLNNIRMDECDLKTNDYLCRT